MKRWHPGALLLCAGLHVGAAWLLLHRAPAPPAASEPAVFMAALVAIPSPAAPSASARRGAPASAAASAASASSAAPAAAAVAAQAVRPALHFYLPAELDREPIVLRDRTADAGITLAVPLVLQLFIDAEGRVVAVRFEGRPPPLGLARQLRAAFGAIEFVPGVLRGRAVPVRLRIELMPPPA